MSLQIADVLMPLALDVAYSYAVPEGLEVAAWHPRDGGRRLEPAVRAWREPEAHHGQARRT